MCVCVCGCFDYSHNLSLEGSKVKRSFCSSISPIAGGDHRTTSTCIIMVKLPILCINNLRKKHPLELQNAFYGQCKFKLWFMYVRSYMYAFCSHHSPPLSGVPTSRPPGGIGYPRRAGGTPPPSTGSAPPFLPPGEELFEETAVSVTVSWRCVCVL